MVNRLVSRLMAPLARRVRLMARRAVVKLVYDDPRMQELQVAIFSGEIRDRVERWQDYGFTSHPFPQAEAIVLALGGNTDHCAVIKVDDRRYRLKSLAEGEVSIFDDQGQAIHLKRDKTIHIYGTDHLVADVAEDVTVNTKVATVNATTSTTITSPDVTVTASTKITCDTPLLTCTGDIHADGSIDATGNMHADGEVSDGVRGISGDRAIYNGHNHQGDSGGTTGAPNQGM